MAIVTDPNVRLFFRTVGADGVIGQDEEIYVKLVDGYVRKLAQDAQPGDLPVIRRDCINKTIDDIHPRIQGGSIMYGLAMGRLHLSPKVSDDSEINTRDLRKPLLRVLLLRGLTRNSTEPKTSLEGKIFGIGSQDFSSTEYTSFAEQVHAVLREGLISRGIPLDHLVSTDTIRTWLKGDTLAPKHWANLECLSQINPEFEAELHEKKAGLNLRSAYDFVMGVRRVVMNRLLHTPNAPEQINGYGKYALETQLAMAQLVDFVDPTTIASRIISIEPLGDQKVDQKAQRAIYTGPLNVPIIPMNEVRDTSYLLDQALISLLERYAFHRILGAANNLLKESGFDSNSFDTNDSLLDAVETGLKEKGADIHINSEDRKIPLRYLKELIALQFIQTEKPHDRRLRRVNTYYVTIGDFFCRLIQASPKEAYTNQRNKEILDAGGQSVGETQNTLDAMYREFNSTLTEQPGEFKEATAISPNDFYTLVDLANRYRNALPRRYLQREADNDRTTLEYCLLRRLEKTGARRKDKRDTDKRYRGGDKKSDKASEQLKREYGITDQVKQFFVANLVDPRKGVRTYEDKWRLKLLPFHELERRKEELEGEHLRFYKRAEVVEVLEKLGIPGIIRAYDPKNFLELFVKLRPEIPTGRYTDFRPANFP